VGKPRVYLCKGGSCRKERKAFRRLEAALEGEARVQHVKCQKICEGPVAGVAVDGTLQWFDALDSRKRTDAFLSLVRTGGVSAKLKKRRVAKRKGKLRD
jgi:hypothetical protein